MVAQHKIRLRPAFRNTLAEMAETGEPIEREVSRKRNGTGPSESLNTSDVWKRPFPSNLLKQIPEAQGNTPRLQSEEEFRAIGGLNPNGPDVANLK